MKATAIALVIVSGYWVAKGFQDLRQDNMDGAWMLGIGLLLLPLAKYLWDRDIGGSRLSK